MTYSSSLAIGRQRFAKPHQNTTSFRVADKTLGPVSNAIILIILMCLLGLMYLTQVTKTNSYGYKIEELTKTQTDLKAEHAELEVAAARLQSLDRVKSSEAAKNLVSVAPSGTVSN
ncbi:hypothetical protein A3D14_03520 [Candidatus Saccharibacteria bacterium RIFCSPHIGHO2_02_FULL_47_12]|nr:MAG: hypothetical protein A3D14_03520 [Candidatus Saccharibacteria bacterium RIFCSPHIGHO2_02_FULL_47_12]